MLGHQRPRPCAASQMLALVLIQRRRVQPRARISDPTQVLVEAGQQFPVAAPNGPARRIDDTTAVTQRVVVDLGTLVRRRLREKEPVVFAHHGGGVARTHRTRRQLVPILGRGSGNVHRVNRMRRVRIVFSARGALIQEERHATQNQTVVLAALGKQLDLLVEPGQRLFQLPCRIALERAATFDHTADEATEQRKRCLRHRSVG